MKIDFDQMEGLASNGLRGGKGAALVKSVSDAHNKIMQGRLAPGASIGGHRHEQDSETLYLVSGQGLMHTEQGTEPLSPGQVSYCPPGAWHSLENIGQEELVFFAVIPRHGS